MTERVITPPKAFGVSFFADKKTAEAVGVRFGVGNTQLKQGVNERAIDANHIPDEAAPPIAGWRDTLRRVPNFRRDAAYSDNIEVRGTTRSISLKSREIFSVFCCYKGISATVVGPIRALINKRKYK